MAATAGIVAYSSGRREILDHMLPLLAFEWAVAEALERHVWQEVGRRRLIDWPWRIECRAKAEERAMLPQLAGIMEHEMPAPVRTTASVY